MIQVQPFLHVASSRLRRASAAAVVAVLAVAAVAAPTSAEPGRVVHRELVHTGSVTLRRICAFPVLVEWETLHEFSYRFTSSDQIDQVWGRHWVRGIDTWSNPANGLAVTVRYAGPLLRSDIEEHFTFDADGDETGYFTATDSYSGNYVGTAPGSGAVVLEAGHAVVLHTSFFVDGVRVRRIDNFIFDAGPSDDFTRLCEYLAG